MIFDSLLRTPKMKRNVIMRPSTTRFLTGFVVAGALGFGVVGAHADSANGPDAGIGIQGYNLDYDHAANGSGPGYPRHPDPRRHHQYSYHRYGSHHYHQ
jgi:hypothetical protein